MPRRSGNPRIRIEADASPVGRATREAEQSLGRMKDSGRRAFSSLKAGAIGAGLALGAGLAVETKRAADAAIEAEKSHARLAAQLGALDISYKKHGDEIDRVIQQHSKLSGFDDEDLQDSFTNIVRVTGDVDKSLRLTGLAADFARAKHIEVAKAGELVGKVAGGNTGILGRYGIKVKEGATAQEALGLLQQKFSGQAKAYGETTAGAMDRASVASENLHEVVGAKLTPIIAAAATHFADFIGQMQKGEGAGGAVAAVFKGIGTAASSIVGFVKGVSHSLSGGNEDASRFATNVKRIADQVIGFAKSLAAGFKTTFAGVGGDIRTIGRAFLKMEAFAAEAVGAVLKRTLPIFKAAIEGIAGIVRGVVKIVAGILSGDWSKAWDGAKQVVSSAIKGLTGTIKGLWGAVGPAMLSLGKFLVRQLWEGVKALPGAVKDGIKLIPGAVKGLWSLAGKGMEALGKFLVRSMVKGLSGLADAIKDKVSKDVESALGAVPILGPGLKFGNDLRNKLGDGIGRKIARSGVVGGATGGDAGLQGADADLSPFARIGASMGLRVSSGMFGRENSITSSGNVSYHGSGDAIDESGPPGAMLRYFRLLRARFGSRLRELIHTPGGIGIKDGKPYQYTGQVAADHYDHVHVAYTGPFGDGVGQASGKGMRWAHAAGTGDGDGFTPEQATVLSTALRAARDVGAGPQATKALVMAILHESGGLNLNHGDASSTGPLQVLAETAASLGIDPRDTYAVSKAFLTKGYWGKGSAITLAKQEGLSTAEIAHLVQGNATGTGVYAAEADKADAAIRAFSAKSTGGRLAHGKDGKSKAAKPKKPTRPRISFPTVGARRPKSSNRGLTPVTNDRTLGPAMLPTEAAAWGGEGQPAGATPLDFAEAAYARAQLTPDTADDMRYLREIEAIRSGQYDAAVNTADPRDDIEAANNLKSARDAIASLDEAVRNSNALAEQAAALLTENTENQRKLIALTTQGPAIVAAVASAVNGAIGGQVGLGFNAPGGPAGQVARL